MILCVKVAGSQVVGVHTRGLVSVFHTRWPRCGVFWGSAREGLVGRVSVSTRGGLVMTVCFVVACLWFHPKGPRDGDL